MDDSFTSSDNTLMFFPSQSEELFQLPDLTEDSTPNSAGAFPWPTSEYYYQSLDYTVGERYNQSQMSPTMRDPDFNFGEWLVDFEQPGQDDYHEHYEQPNQRGDYEHDAHYEIGQNPPANTVIDREEHDQRARLFREITQNVCRELPANTAPREPLPLTPPILPSQSNLAWHRPRNVAVEDPAHHIERWFASNADPVDIHGRPFAVDYEHESVVADSPILPRQPAPARPMNYAMPQDEQIIHAPVPQRLEDATRPPHILSRRESRQLLVEEMQHEDDVAIGKTTAVTEESTEEKAQRERDRIMRYEIDLEAWRYRQEQRKNRRRSLLEEMIDTEPQLHHYK